MARARDNDELTTLAFGATITELAVIFGGSTMDVRKKVMGRVKPVTSLGEKPERFRIKDAAPFLITHRIDADVIEQTIRKMTPDKLPPKLSDAFWAGQNRKLDYQIRRGELWKTERVVKVIADAYKPLAIAIKLFSDTVAQQEELSVGQQELIVQMSDGLLKSLHDALITAFLDYTPEPDEHGDPVSNEEGNAVITVREEEDDGFGD